MVSSDVLTRAVVIEVGSRQHRCRELSELGVVGWDC